MSGYFVANNNPSKLGGGAPGHQPQLIGGGANSNSGSGMVGSSERGQSRMILREAMGRTLWLRDATGSVGSIKTTPFRVAMNAGDIRGTVNEAPDAKLPRPNQVNGPGVNRTEARGDGVQTGNSAFTGNPRFVYDGSDYTRYKKLKAKLNTYNDKSFGGSNNGSYSFLMRVRG